MKEKIEGTSWMVSRLPNALSWKYLLVLWVIEDALNLSSGKLLAATGTLLLVSETSSWCWIIWIKCLTVLSNWLKKISLEPVPCQPRSMLENPAGTKGNFVSDRFFSLEVFKHCWPWFCSKSLVRKGKPDVCQIILSKANFPRLYSPWATAVSTESYSSVDEMNGHNKWLSLTQWVFCIKKNSGYLILTLIQPFKFPQDKGLLVIVVKKTKSFSYNLNAVQNKIYHSISGS